MPFRPRSAPWVLLALAGAAASAAPASAAPARLPILDPLHLAVPARSLAEESLSGAADPQRDLDPGAQARASKLLGGVWDPLADPAEIPVIVLLKEGLVGKSLDPGGTDGDEPRVLAVATLAQSFVRRAEPVGLAATGALSHLPVVFGRIAGTHLAALAALPEVAAVEPDRRFFPTRVEGGALVRSTELRTSFGGDGAGIGIAIIDTGVDASHPELASRVVTQADLTDPDGDGTLDTLGHGTSVAGIAAGASGGMAPAARLWALKVYGADGHAQESAILAGLNAALANRNSFGGLRIVNLAIGDGMAHNTACDADFPAFATVVDALVGAGVSVFIAAGNGGFGNGVNAPSCLANAISVGAVLDASLGSRTFENCTDPVTEADRVPCYSNSGAPLDLLAPSHCARAPHPGGGYKSCFGGTSAASPYAAGVAAQILSLRPDLTPAQLRAALETTGKPIADPRTGLVRPRVDAVAAYQALPPATGASCVRDAHTACLLSGRFEVQVEWQTTTDRGPASLMSFGGQRAESDFSAFLWFFNADNFEIGVKMVDACGDPFNAHWVFINGLTNQGYTVTVRDTQPGGATKTYSNPLGQDSRLIVDLQAFGCP